MLYTEQNVHFGITKCLVFAAKVLISNELRKQNHKKPTNISNFLRFLGGKELKEDYLEQLHALN